jgi:hypothetical protein
MGHYMTTPWQHELPPTALSYPRETARTPAGSRQPGGNAAQQYEMAYLRGPGAQPGQVPVPSPTPTGWVTPYAAGDREVACGCPREPQLLELQQHARYAGHQPPNENCACTSIHRSALRS